MLEIPNVILKFLSNDDLYQINVIIFLIIKLDLSYVDMHPQLKLQFNTCHIISFAKKFGKFFRINDTTLYLFY